MSRRGVILFIVIGTILIVTVLGTVILSIISSQSRLTHRQVGRIQAYYAAWAGVNYALDKLRLDNDNKWRMPNPNKSYTRTICSAAGLGCNEPSGDVIDTTIPSSVSTVQIRVAGKDISGCDPPSADIPACISATANYTYTP